MSEIDVKCGARSPVGAKRDPPVGHAGTDRQGWERGERAWWLRGMDEQGMQAASEPGTIASIDGANTSRVGMAPAMEAKGRAQKAHRKAVCLVGLLRPVVDESARRDGSCCWRLSIRWRGQPTARSYAGPWPPPGSRRASS